MSTDGYAEGNNSDDFVLMLEGSDRGTTKEYTNYGLCEDGDVISISVDFEGCKVSFCKNGRDWYSTDLTALYAPDKQAYVFFVHMPNGLHMDGYTFPFDSDNRYVVAPLGSVNHFYDAKRTLCESSEENLYWQLPIPRRNVGASVTILNGLPKSAKQVGEKRKRRDAAD